jgi:hypothetical protein
MKTAVLCVTALLASASAYAQTSAPAAPDQPEKSVTLTGCVAGGSASTPITLTNALIIPGTPQAGQLDQTPSPVPPQVSSTATEPGDPTLPPPTAAPVVPATPPSVTGTAGTKTPSTAVGTSGVVTGTAPAGSSASSLTGYRLSGADMEPWIGKRVQLIGVFVPATAGLATQPPMREFRVVTVTPTIGSCPH